MTKSAEYGRLEKWRGRFGAEWRELAERLGESRWAGLPPAPRACPARDRPPRSPHLPSGQAGLYWSRDGGSRASLLRSPRPRRPVPAGGSLRRTFCPLTITDLHEQDRGRSAFSDVTAVERTSQAFKAHRAAHGLGQRLARDQQRVVAFDCDFFNRGK